MEQYYTFSCMSEEAYIVVTRLQTKAGGNQMPKVHGADKVVDPALDLSQERRDIPACPKGT